MNEYADAAWIEGPWMIKRAGVYYLEYSASGTQWLSYATGVYTSKSPLGPFQYSPVNPLLRKTSSIVTGTGHGSVVKGPDGNWWQFLPIVLARSSRRPPPRHGSRGLQPERQLVHPRPSETPQWGPGVGRPNPARHRDSGSIPLTIRKLRRAMNQKGGFSSQRQADAAYAFDR